jgi:hypothetical protein
MRNKETLEEVAERFYSDEEYPLYGEIRRYCFITGAKWQQEQDKKLYSEEDMQEYAEFCIRCNREGLPCIVVKDWFEQFKNK